MLYMHGPLGQLACKADAYHRQMHQRRTESEKKPAFGRSLTAQTGFKLGALPTLSQQLPLDDVRWSHVPKGRHEAGLKGFALISFWTLCVAIEQVDHG